MATTYKVHFTSDPNLTYADFKALAIMGKSGLAMKYRKGIACGAARAIRVDLTHDWAKVTCDKCLNSAVAPASH
jgi:hypothetical protein